jgi:hypothetical protein
MVQIQENWCEVTGAVIEATAERGAGGERSLLRLRLERLQPVPGFPTLLEAEPGSELRIHLRRMQLDAAVRPGATVTIRVRRAGVADLWAHPDWRLSAESLAKG